MPSHLPLPMSSAAPRFREWLNRVSTLRAFRRGLALATAFTLASAPAGAQTALTLDGSLPNGRTDDLTTTQSGPLYIIDETMGESRGSNLFHSFRDFSIGMDHTAQFQAGQPFDRVLVRVTGEQGSEIRGTLRSTVTRAGGGGADLFVLNPNGILIGGGASIDVPGSLYLSTAHTLTFDDGLTLDLANAPAPVLSMATPESFGFLGGTLAAEVAFTEDTESGFLSLSFSPGETVAAIGGQVRIEATPTSDLNLTSPGSRFALVATGAANASVDANTFEISTPTPEQLGLVRIASNAALNGFDFADPNADQGQLVIRGGRLEMDAFAVAEFGGNAGSDAAIDIEVEEAILIEGTSFLVVGTQGASPGGKARLDASRIEIRDVASGVYSSSIGTGGGANIELRADALIIEDGATLDSGGNALSPSGSILLDVNDVEVSGSSSIRLLGDANNTQPPSLRIGAGEGAGQVRITGNSAILSQTRSSSDGAAIEIETGVLEVLDGGVIESSTLASASGNAGAIIITADDVLVSRTAPSETAGFIATASQVNSLGSGGDILINTNTLRVDEGGQISTTSEGRNAGNIQITADSEVVLQGDNGGATPSGLFSRALASGNGRSGAINVAAPRIQVLDGASISTITNSVGGSGSILLDADESIEIRGRGNIGSLVSSQTFVGLGGNITLEAPRVVVEDGGAVDLTTRSDQQGGLLRIEADELRVRGDGNGTPTLAAIATNTGDAQGIDIQVTGGVEIRDGGLLTTRAQDTGEAGDIRITANEVTVASGGLIETRTVQGSTANAGNVSIDTTGEILVDGAGSRITTQAAVALGGNILLRATHRVTLNDAAVTASVGSGTGNGGNVTIEAPLIIQNAAAVSATAAAGNGGDIAYTTSLFVESGDSLRDASSFAGVDGEISSSVPAEDLSGQLIALDASLLGAEDQLSQDCALRDQRVGSFTIRKRADTRRFDADELDLSNGRAKEGSHYERPDGENACGGR